MKHKSTSLQLYIQETMSTQESYGITCLMGFISKWALIWTSCLWSLRHADFSLEKVFSSWDEQSRPPSYYPLAG